MQKYANLVDLVKSFPTSKADVQKKPKGGHGKKEAAGAASKRCRKDSSGDHGIACKKAKPK